MLELVESFKGKGVSIVSFKENVDTRTPQGKRMLTMLGAIAEFERDCILERQKEGIAIAKAEGKYKGRKKIDFLSNWEDVYNRYKTREITGNQDMEMLELKRNTFYKLKKEWDKE